MKLKAFLYQIVSSPFNGETEVGTFSYIQNILYSKNIAEYNDDGSYLLDFFQSTFEKVQKILDCLDIREVDITPFLNNIRINFSGNGVSNGSLVLHYSDESLQNKLNSRYFRIQFKQNNSFFLDEKKFNNTIEEKNENNVISFKDIVNRIRNYDFIRIVDGETEKTIFIGVIKNYEFFIGVDQVYSLTIELSSIMDFFQYNHINTLEAIYNKLQLSLPKEKTEEFKKSFKNIINFDALVPFENWFQNKTFEEIIEIIFGDFLSAEIEIKTNINKNMDIPISYASFKLPLTKEEIEKYQKESIGLNSIEKNIKEIINDIAEEQSHPSSEDYYNLNIIQCLPSLYNLFMNLQSKKVFFGIKFLILLHFIYDYIEDKKPIAYFVIEKNKYPYILKIIENFDMINFKFESMYSILDEIAKNLIYEFFEQVGSTIFFKPPYYNLKEIVTIWDESLVNSISYKYNKQTNPNIYTVNMVKDVLGDLSSVYLLRSFIDFESIIKYGSNIGGSITSPFGKEFAELKNLMELAKFFYAYDITNLNTASLSLIDLFINNKPFVLNQAYDIMFGHIVEHLSGYLKDISINYSVDMIPSVNLSFTYIDRIFRENLNDKIKIVRLKFMKDISSAMAIYFDKQGKYEAIEINNQKVAKIDDSFKKSLCLLLIKSKLWNELKEEFKNFYNIKGNSIKEKNTKLGIAIGIEKKFDDIKKQDKLEPLSNIIYKDYSAEMKNFKFNYESFKINEQIIINKKNKDIYVNVNGLFNYCMSIILGEIIFGSSVSGTVYLENITNVLKSGIANAIKNRQENIEQFNKDIDFISSTLKDISNFLNDFELLVTTPYMAEI
jgi:hypothetical protein